jgi:hypothetical protein
MNMKEKPRDLKLKIELVPTSSWYDNLRKYWLVDLREYKEIIKWRH